MAENKETKELTEEVKPTKAKPVKKEAPKVEAKMPTSYIHIDEFLEMAKFIYPELNSMTCAGFKAHVAPNMYFIDELELKEKLDKYLGK